MKILFPLVTVLLATSVVADELKDRLIQTSPTQKQWMSLSQVESLARDNHDPKKNGGKARCPGFIDVTDREFVPNSKKKSSIDFEKLKFTQGSLVASLFKKVEAKNLSEWVRQLSSFQNRHCKSTSGKNASLFIQEQMKTLSKNNPAIKSELFAHTRFTQSSVITRWEGTGSDAKKTIVVGAHLDSINHVNNDPIETEPAPGADDDASGVATVLEAFKILVDSGYQPKHSFEFMMYAGEEIGLVGSQDIAENYSQKSKDVVSALQMDMTMYPADESKISIYTDYTHLGFNHYLGKIIDQYIKVPYVYEQCGYACSDHASWDRYGYPSAFPFEVPYQKDNPFIHSSRDTLDRLNPDFGTHFLKLTLAYLVELDQGI